MSTSDVRARKETTVPGSLPHRRRIKVALVAALALDVGVAMVTSGVASAAPTSARRTSDSTVAAAKAKAFAKLKILKDGVSVRRKGKTVFKPASDGQRLRVGDTIQTDATGEAEVDYTQETFTRLDVSTTFTIKHLTDNQGHRQVEGSLDTGRTWNRTSALTESESFSQDGAGATASVVGSAFMAECDTAGHCTFTSVVDGLKLVTVDGDVKLLTPLEQCDSTEIDPTNANLCGVPAPVAADVLAANTWIQQNLFFDGQAGFPGPTITVTIVVTNGVVTTVTPTPPPADNPPGPTAPDAPTGVSAVAGDGEATVSWAAPASDGGSAITGYTVTAASSGITAANVIPTCTWTSGPLSCTVTGLANGDSYTFTVTATNAIGTSDASDPSSAVTPATVPDAPTGVSAVAGDRKATVSWSAPAFNGGSTITGYTVTGAPGGSCTTSGALSCEVSGLTNGVAYTFTVTATNAVGTGAPSDPSSAVTPATVPDAPTGVSAVAGDRKATVSWSAPVSDGGSAITGYTVTGAPGGSCSTSGALSCEVSGLTNGVAYTFTVTATNVAGTGAPSGPSSAVTPHAPPPSVNSVNPLTVTSQDGPYSGYSATPNGSSPQLVVGDEFKDTKFTINGVPGGSDPVSWIYFTAMNNDPSKGSHTGMVCAPTTGPSTGAHCGDGLSSGESGSLGAADYAPVALDTPYAAGTEFSFLAFDYEHKVGGPKVDPAAFTVKVEDSTGQQSAPQSVQVTVSEAPAS